MCHPCHHLQRCCVSYFLAAVKVGVVVVMMEAVVVVALSLAAEQS